MKKLIFPALTVAVLALVLVYSLVLKKPLQLISPVVKHNVLGISQWFPKIIDKEYQVPQITAKSALFLTTQEGESIYAKNIRERLPIASLVKIMTVLIALENKSLDDQFLVSANAAGVEPDKMFLVAGERLSLKELLYGIFLVSANDAAETLAEGVTGDRIEFIKMMNDKAKQLGMNDTYFVNPTGFDEDVENSYSTAYDLAILTRYIIRRYPQVVEISKTDHIYLPQTETHQAYDLYSGINLLTTYPGVVGFKTGYTPMAGLTLITLAQKDGQEIIGLLLDSQNRRDEARELLEYSYKKLGIPVI